MKRQSSTILRGFSTFKAVIRSLWLCLLLSALPALVQGQFTYVTNNGTITITGYTGSAAVVSIPETLNGFPVVAIGSYAFADRFLPKSVIIPQTVTSIEANAFRASGGLTNIDVPNSVTNLGAAAFSGCSGLATAKLPDGLKNMTTSLFESCSALRDASIPTGVTNIGARAFCSCSGLTTLTIPNSVISIGTYAFAYCRNVTNITIGTNVATIADSAFIVCPKVGDVLLPSSLRSIGPGAFAFCSGMSNIRVDPLNSRYSDLDGVLFDKSQLNLLECPTGKVGDYIIPGSVTNIGYEAFIGCPNITTITVPDNVSSIDTFAFHSCEGLRSLTIGKGVMKMGANPFIGCDSLTNIIVASENAAFCSIDGVVLDRPRTQLIAYPPGRVGSYVIPDGVKGIRPAAFDGCTNLTSITLPSGFITTGDFAFVDCFGLTNITLAEGLRTIGYQAFFYCDHLPRITIPATVTNIGGGAFEWCSDLIGVYFEGDAPGVGSIPFQGCNATVYYLPGTSGWGSTFGDRPTAPWVLPNPLILHGSVGASGSGLGFTVSWATNASVTVEACTDLNSPTWQPLQSSALANGSWKFSDAQWTNYPARFYRVRSP